MKSRREFVLMAGVAAPILTGAAAEPGVSAPREPAAAQIFVIRYRPGPAWVAGTPMAQQNLRPHALYYRDLLEQGKVFAAGGWVGVDGGMAILQVATIEEARAILAADPAIVSGVFEADLDQWRPRFRVATPLP